MNFKQILEKLEVKKFQCCGEETDSVSGIERYCKKCKATWNKKEAGWAKEKK